MAKVKVIKKTGGGTKYRFHCPGCDEMHSINDNWGFNGDLDRPTFTPSVLTTTGHFVPGHSGDCWCTYEKKRGKKAPFKCKRCHSFVTDGQIRFLGDCTHELAGKTVDLPEIE